VKSRRLKVSTSSILFLCRNSNPWLEQRADRKPLLHPCCPPPSPPPGHLVLKNLWESTCSAYSLKNLWESSLSANSCLCYSKSCKRNSLVCVCVCVCVCVRETEKRERRERERERERRVSACVHLFTHVQIHRIYKSFPEIFLCFKIREKEHTRPNTHTNTHSNLKKLAGP
jgi:hypothetical protein